MSHSQPLPDGHVRREQSLLTGKLSYHRVNMRVMQGGSSSRWKKSSASQSGNGGRRRNGLAELAAGERRHGASNPMSRTIRRPRGHWCLTPPRYPGDPTGTAPTLARRRTSFATLKTHLYRPYLRSKGGAHGGRQMPKNTEDCQ